MASWWHGLGAFHSSAVLRWRGISGEWVQIVIKKTAWERLVICLRDGLISLAFIPSGNGFYSSGFPFKDTLHSVLMCSAVVFASTCNDGVLPGDHEEEMQVMGYLMPSTLRKSNQVLDQVAKNFNENSDINSYWQVPLVYKMIFH